MVTKRKVPGIDSRKTRPKQVQTMDSMLARTIEEGECLIWQGYSGMRVPQVSHEGRMVPVRRLMLEISDRNLWPDGYATTNCGNQSCVNPEHIAYRNKHQHALAMLQAPRNELVRASKLAAFKRAHAAKITIEIAREIRSSEDSGPVLAERFGIDKSQVSRIRRGEGWREFEANPFSGLGARA